MRTTALAFEYRDQPVMLRACMRKRQPAAQRSERASNAPARTTATVLHAAHPAPSPPASPRASPPSMRRCTRTSHACSGRQSVAHPGHATATDAALVAAATGAACIALEETPSANGGDGGPAALEPLALCATTRASYAAAARRPCSVSSPREGTRVEASAARHVCQPSSARAPMAASRHCSEWYSSPEQPPRSRGMRSVSAEHVEPSMPGASSGVSGGWSAASVVATAVDESSPQPPSLWARTRSWYVAEGERPVSSVAGLLLPVSKWDGSASPPPCCSSARR